MLLKRLPVYASCISCAIVFVIHKNNITISWLLLFFLWYVEHCCRNFSFIGCECQLSYEKSSLLDWYIVFYELSLVLIYTIAPSCSFQNTMYYMYIYKFISACRPVSSSLNHLVLNNCRLWTNWPGSAMKGLFMGYRAPILPSLCDRATQQLDTSFVWKVALSVSNRYFQ